MCFDLCAPPLDTVGSFSPLIFAIYSARVEISMEVKAETVDGIGIRDGIGVDWNGWLEWNSDLSFLGAGVICWDGTHPLCSNHALKPVARRMSPSVSVSWWSKQQRSSEQVSAKNETESNLFQTMHRTCMKCICFELDDKQQNSIVTVVDRLNGSALVRVHKLEVGNYRGKE